MKTKLPDVKFRQIPATLTDGWRALEALAIAVGISEHEREGQRIAYYGGALAVFEILNGASSSGSVSDCLAAFVSTRAEIDVAMLDIRSKNELKLANAVTGGTTH